MKRASIARAARERSDMEQAQLHALYRELESVRDDLRRIELDSAERLAALHSHHQQSGRNLLHYLAFRQRDIRPLQERLAVQGLSSLGRAEAHVMHSVQTVMRALRSLREEAPDSADDLIPPVNFMEGKTLLEKHTLAALGSPHANRQVRIMVTMPSEAADDFQLMREMLLGGMDCMRINCAHDDSNAWSRMIANLRRAERDTGRRCHVLMDLPGPKLRTGAIEPGPRALKWRPQRDDFGKRLATARIWLTPQETPQLPPAAADAALPVPEAWVTALAPGDKIAFLDTRGASRSLRVVAASESSRWAESSQTCYVATGTLLTRLSASKSDSQGPPLEAAVGLLPPKERALRLSRGDTLVLTRAQTPGHPAAYDRQGRLLNSARIPCTLPEIFNDVRVGERVLFDDGKIGGVIKAVSEAEMHVQITQARPQGDRLRAEKGVNFPDSALHLSALTANDIEHLDFIADNADLVGLSFVHSEQDVRALQSRLSERCGKEPGIILKIETRQAFENLPELLLTAMRNSCAGVMIARGDLAVECGFERLAEVQEEILWICEAAHLPVIWATQVLESLAQTGLPSRAEITDAAMGVRAECVMLNKGPHILEAIRLLDGILQRMQAHQSKKATLLRQLRAWTKDEESPSAELTSPV